MLGEVLRERMLQEDGYEAAMQAYLGQQASALKQDGGSPSRDEFHDRALLR